MQPISVTVGGFAAAVTDAIAASQTPLAAGNLTLTATPYVIDPPRRMTITAAGDESARTFTVYGTTYGGGSITEVIAGPNTTTATSTMDFATVTQIAVDAATAGAVEAGLAQAGASRWVRMDDWAPSYISIQCVASGTVDYSIEYTLDDPNSYQNPVSPINVTWAQSDDPDVTNATGNATSNFIFAPTFARVVINSGDGTVRTTFLQSFGGV